MSASHPVIAIVDDEESVRKALERLLGVFAYPHKKVQSRISSLLENDPLPLVSVYIDNMHVDEVQIDGGDTEEVVAGNMEPGPASYLP